MQTISQSLNKQGIGSGVINTKQTHLCNFAGSNPLSAYRCLDSRFHREKEVGCCKKRSRLATPTPQGSLQADQALQDDHDPSTRAGNEVDNLQYYLNHFAFEKRKIFIPVCCNGIDKSCLRYLGPYLHNVECYFECRKK